jgi:hypothetical protein
MIWSGVLVHLKGRAESFQGLFTYNAAGDDHSAAFLGKDLDAHLPLVHRNCHSVLEAAYLFGGPMVTRERGALVLVTSGAAWVGGATLAAYGDPRRSTSSRRKACGAMACQRGVCPGACARRDPYRIPAPGARRQGRILREFAAPRGVAEEAHEHLIDGPS